MQRMMKMNKPRIQRRWYCSTCNKTWEGIPPPCHSTHIVSRICGYKDCVQQVRPGQLTCSEEHGVLAARAAIGLHGLQAPATGPNSRFTGLWLFRERLRLGLTRAQAASQLGCHATPLYVMEVHDRPIPPGWLPRLAKLGIPVDE